MSMLWPALNTPELNYISKAPSLDFINSDVRQIVILGSTGSIGKHALDIIAQSSDLHPIGLACATNIELLAQQALKWQPPYLAVLLEELAQKLREKLSDFYKPEIYWGMEGYARLGACTKADCILSAQAGSAGLPGTLAAACAGKVIALANKESLVMAGDLLRSICKQTGASILPVDSEHYAIFQCLAGVPGKEIAELVLTASGGPFLGKKCADLASISPEQAKSHPKWQMGTKISIDSATLMNKGLEYIEAIRLYGVAPDKIKILIHPQSIVHSLVRFTDASLLGQMACPDMRLPIAACLYWPKRLKPYVSPLDLAQESPLTFTHPDMETFACLKHAITAASWQPPIEWQQIDLNPACIILNAANEKAVKDFLNGKTGFCEIPKEVGKAVNKIIKNCPPPPRIFIEDDPIKTALNIGWAIDNWVRKNL